MYNVMDKETTTSLWSKLEILYMTKSLSNKLYLKKQLYRLRMKRGTTILEHLNFFNKVISELLAVDVKIVEDNNVLILLSSLSESYDRIVTTILYEKGTLILEELTSSLVPSLVIKPSRRNNTEGEEDAKSEEMKEQVDREMYSCNFVRFKGKTNTLCGNQRKG